MTFEHADGDQMALQHRTDLGHDRRHVDAALLQVAAARIEHRLKLLYEEGAVATLAEHRRHDAGQRHDPLEVVHVLRIDEYLERPALLVRGAGVEHNVVHGDVKGMLEQRRLDLVGHADKRFRTLQALVHFHHVDGLARLVIGAGRSGRGAFEGLVDDLEALDALGDLYGHCADSPAGRSDGPALIRLAVRFSTCRNSLL